VGRVVAQLNRLDDDKDFIQWNSRCGQEILKSCLLCSSPSNNQLNTKLRVVDVSYDVQKPEEEHHRNWFPSCSLLFSWVNDMEVSLFLLSWHIGNLGTVELTVLTVCLRKGGFCMY
jgi:hypothetical protein